MEKLSTCLALGLGGALGTVARYSLSLWQMPHNSYLPYGTLLVNILGSLLVGFFGTLTLADGKYPVSEQLRLFLMVGVGGGFTTFSAFSLQTLELFQAGAWLWATLNILLSVGLCVGAIAVGHLAGAYLNNGARRIAQTESEKF